MNGMVKIAAGAATCEEVSRVRFLHIASFPLPAPVKAGIKHPLATGAERLIQLSSTSDTAVEVVSGNAYSRRYNDLQAATRITFRPRSLRKPHVVQVRVIEPVNGVRSHTM